MGSKLNKIKEAFSKDKRLCERLTLPAAMRYASVPDPAGAGAPEWSEITQLENLGGGGLGFCADAALPKGQKLTVELMLPCDPDPFVFTAEVVHVEDGQGPDRDRFFYGVRIMDLQTGSRKMFEQFITDGIIDKYIDDGGGFKDIGD